jgi:hypothetical protein
MQELVASLSPDKQARVKGIPLVFDPNPNDVNAFAGCDDSGAPFLAGTEGLLEAVDAISQTRATDEMFGTQTYEAYASAVVPQLVRQGGSSALLPPGIVPMQYLLSPQRISRAHEIFDEIVGFTFGHELGHHYLGHTGCANGQGMNSGPLAEKLPQLLGKLGGGFNQPNEISADNAGCINVLNAGKARSVAGYRWNEEGGLWLMDFFARLERASGNNPLLGILRTHPNPGVRIPLLQVAATGWRWQHPG